MQTQRNGKTIRTGRIGSLEDLSGYCQDAQHPLITSLDDAINTSNTQIYFGALIAFAVMGADAMYGFLLSYQQRKMDRGITIDIAISHPSW